MRLLAPDELVHGSNKLSRGAGEPKQKTRIWWYLGRGGPYSLEPHGQPIVHLRTATSRSTTRASSLPVVNHVEWKKGLCLKWTGLGALKVHEAGNSLNGLLSGVTVRNGKLGRVSVLLASGEMSWVTWDAKDSPGFVWK